MQGARNDLQIALGKQYQDSYWGFGQVTIMVMLLPSIYDVVSRIISTFHVLPFHWSAAEPSQSSAQNPMVEQRKADHQEAEPILDSNADDLGLNMRDQVSIPPGSPTPEGRHSEGDPLGESSSRSSHAAGNAEIFELTRRANTFPRDMEGNILPVHT